MKSFKDITSLKVYDVVCDVCGDSCRKNFNIESASISVEWGYDSKNDGDVYDIDLCENCFLKAIGYLKSFAADPNKLNPTSILPAE